MAKKKKASYRRYFGGKIKRGYAKTTGFLGGDVGKGLLGLGYGALRPRLMRNEMVVNNVNKLPFGDINDEVAFGATAWILSKLTKAKLLNQIKDTVLTVETYRIGEVKMGGNGTTSTSTSSSGYTAADFGV